MIDTITLMIDGNLLPQPEGWKISNQTSETKSIYVRRYTHEETGLRVQETRDRSLSTRKSIDEKKMSLEVSLPRLLGKNNYYQVRPSDFPECIKKLNLTLKEAVGNLRLRHITRLDVCYQIRRSTVDIINMHRTVRHPRIRNEVEIYGTKGITWPGKERRIRIYDKLREVFRKSLSGPVCRIEAQYRGKVLKEIFGDKDKDFYLQDVDFKRCYHALRSDMCSIVPVKSDSSKVTLAYAIHHFGNHRVPDREETLFEVWRKDKSLQSVRKMEKKIQAFNLESEVFDWSNVFPEKLTNVHFVEPTQEEISFYCMQAGVKMVGT